MCTEVHGGRPVKSGRGSLGFNAVTRRQKQGRPRGPPGSSKSVAGPLYHLSSEWTLAEPLRRCFFPGICRSAAAVTRWVASFVFLTSRHLSVHLKDFNKTPHARAYASMTVVGEAAAGLKRALRCVSPLFYCLISARSLSRSPSSSLTLPRSSQTRLQPCPFLFKLITSATLYPQPPGTLTTVRPVLFLKFKQSSYVLYC